MFGWFVWTGVLLDPLAKLGSTVQEFSLLPYFMVFCKGAFRITTELELSLVALQCSGLNSYSRLPSFT